MLRKTAVVIGDALIDEIESPDRSTDYVGGAGLNVAVGLARLGVRATLIAAIGDDQDGQSIRAFLEAHNVQLLATISDLGTSRAVSQRLNGEPRYSFNAAAVRREIHLGEAERQALDSAAMVVISSFPFDNPGQVAQLEDAITDPGKRLVVDPNPRPGLLRDAEAFDANFKRVAAHSLLAKISDEDAALLGAGDLPSMADALILAGTGHVLATAGPRGASISTADGVRLSQPVAILPGPVVDTMGAGDATLASTVKALMEEDIPDTSLFWADLLSAAMAVAAATCRSQGALLQLPTTAVAEHHSSRPLGKDKPMTKTLYAEFTVKPGGEERVAQMMRELTLHVRQEPGNVLFNPYVRETNPREYFVFEIYRDEDAFQSHISADYGARFNAELGDLIEGDGSALTWLTPLV